MAIALRRMSCCWTTPRACCDAGVDYIAHSVRDREVDDEFIRLMKNRHVFYSPTLTRELAVFTYSETPAFFSDPFFLKEADPAEMVKMEDPKRQESMRNDKGALWYKEHLPIAMQNLKTISDAGIVIASRDRQRWRPWPLPGLLRTS